MMTAASAACGRKKISLVKNSRNRSTNSPAKTALRPVFAPETSLRAEREKEPLTG
jgi:hypothetical protein